MDVLFDKLTRREWEAFADQAEAGLQQRWSYGEAVRAIGGRVCRLAVRLDGDLVMIAQVLMRGIGALINRGPIWRAGTDDSMRKDILRKVRQSLRQRGVRICAVTSPSGEFDTGIAVMTPATQAYLPVAPPDRDAMHGKWRNRLRAAEAAGLKITKLPNRPEKLNWLIEAEQVQRKARGYRALPPGFIGAWLTSDAANVLTLGVHHDGAPVSAMMFLRHGSTASYHLGWSNPSGRALNAHNLILWQAAKRLSKKGVRLLDLGQLDTVNAPGLARFKLGSGAKPHRFGATRLVF